jgi:hypothetical protein
MDAPPIKPAGTSRPWLTLGICGGLLVHSAERVLATGLEPVARTALVVGALGDDSLPAILLREGHDLGPLGGRAVLHYDMTGMCQGDHSHVVWDLSGIRLEVLAHLVIDLVVAIQDPAWAPPPGAGARLSDTHQLLSPDLLTIAPLLATVLWAAGHSGGGVREAMDWLVPDQLEQAVACCRSIVGEQRMVLFDAMERLLGGTAEVRQAAIYKAWHALAPIEAIQRNVTARQSVQRLDVGGWLKARSVLAVSLPPAATVGHQQVVAALLTAALREQSPVPLASRPGPSVPRTERCVWLDVPKPKHWEWHRSEIIDQTENSPRALVVADAAAQFEPWMGSKQSHDVLIGALAQPPTLGVAGALIGRELDRPAPGQVMLIRGGQVHTLIAPTMD